MAAMREVKEETGVSSYHEVLYLYQIGNETCVWVLESIVYLMIAWFFVQIDTEFVEVLAFR